MQRSGPVPHNNNETKQNQIYHFLESITTAPVRFVWGGRRFRPAINLKILPTNASNMKANPPGGREKILLVEDDADVRMVMRGVLEASGYQIWEATDGVEALNVWKTNASQIDLLLTDIIMPGGLTGWELADRLRKERPDLKVILMSGYGPEKAGKIQLHSHILQKPFTLENLTEMVRSCLDTACLSRRNISERIADSSI